MEQEELMNEETAETSEEVTEISEETETEEPTEEQEETLTSTVSELMSEELTTSTTTSIPATLDVEAVNTFTHYGIGLMLVIVLLIAFRLVYSFFRIFF